MSIIDPSSFKTTVATTTINTTVVTEEATTRDIRIGMLIKGEGSQQQSDDDDVASGDDDSGDDEQLRLLQQQQLRPTDSKAPTIFLSETPLHVFHYSDFATVRGVLELTHTRQLLVWFVDLSRFCKHIKRLDYDGTLVEAMIGHTNAVITAIESNNSEWVASGAEDTTVRVWNTSTVSSSTYGCIAVLEGHRSRVSVLIHLRSDGDYLVSGSYDCTIKVWDTTEWSCVKTLPPDSDTNDFFGRIYGLCQIEDGSERMASRTPRSLTLWHLPSGSVVWKKRLDTNGNLFHLYDNSYDHYYNRLLVCGDGLLIDLQGDQGIVNQFKMGFHLSFNLLRNCVLMCGSLDLVTFYSREGMEMSKWRHPAHIHKMVSIQDSRVVLVYETVHKNEDFDEDLVSPHNFGKKWVSNYYLEIRRLYNT